MFSSSVKKVFISHSSIDTWVASQLANHIQECGAETFLDEANIQLGDDFDDVIVKAAANSDELVILLTPWSVERPYIWIEIGLFRRDEKRIIGVLYGLNDLDISTDPRMPALLKKINLVKINEIQSYFEQLRARINLREHTND